jgi:hypothetical protein
MPLGPKAGRRPRMLASLESLGLNMPNQAHARTWSKDTGAKQGLPAEPPFHVPSQANRMASTHR